MPPTRLLPLPLLLALIGGGAVADDDGFPLRFTPRLAAPAAVDRETLPVFMDADRLYGVQDRYIEAEGEVVVRRRGESLQADWMRYDQPEDRLRARGNVVVVQDGRRIEGEELALQLTTHIGEMRAVRYEARGARGEYGRGEADMLHFEGEGQYRLAAATYTTCPVGNDDWQVRAGELELDNIRNLGVARDVKIEYLGVPIVYAPWLDFALDGSRKTGFLTPSYGASDKRGIELTAPWYWNIAPNRDATLTPRYMSKRGLQLGAQFRYLEPDYAGDLNLEYLPGDAQADRDRYHGLIRHSQRFTPRLSGGLTVERASDDAYFRDLSSLVNQTSQVHLPRDGFLSYSGGWWTAAGRVQSFQTLQDPAAPILEPFRRLPQLTFSAARMEPGGYPLDAGLAAEFVSFEHPAGAQPQGRRTYAYPSVTFPLATHYAYLTPKLGWHLTRYDLDRNDQNPQLLQETRSLPILSLDSGLQFERDWHFAGRGYLQTLEPRLYYVYIPYRDQSGLPVFDTGLRDVSLDALFSENQFIGVDRINDANQLTLAVTTRFLEPENGLERLQLTLGQRYYFAGQRVVLPGGKARDSDASDVLAQLSGQITDRLRLRAGLQMGTDTGNVVKTGFGAQYRHSPGRVVNLDYRYDDPGNIDQVDLSWQWPLAARWHGLGRLNYSFYDQRIVEGLLGFEYNAGCWSLRGVAQRLAITQTEATNAFFLQLELHDLTQLGPNPLEVLKRSIPGYAKSDELDLP